MLSRDVYLRDYPMGVPTRELFELRERLLPAVEDGQVLVRNRWMSVDPYMRGRMSLAPSYVPPFRLDRPLEGGSVGQVIASRHAGFPEGTWVLSQQGGWKQAFLTKGRDLRRIDPAEAPPAAWLGVLGLTGFSAYVGLVVLADVRPGQTVCVSAAAGAVGLAVGQIAKALGARSVGIAGGKDKCRWLTTDIGFDAAVDYKDERPLAAALAEACPDGIDIAFENVGGEPFHAALSAMNTRGRVIVCGMIEDYNGPTGRPMSNNLIEIAKRSLSVQGFIVGDFSGHHCEFETRMHAWLGQGVVRPIETVRQGIDAAPQAFLDLFAGGNRGKMLVAL